jgi:hypothetical protein
MSPEAEAKAGLAPHRLLGALDHRPDRGPVRNLRERIEGRPHALKRISNGLPDFPADLCQGVSQFGVPVFAHGRILSLAPTQSQGTFPPVGHLRPCCWCSGRAISALMAYVAAVWWAGARLPRACCNCLAVSLVVPRRVASEGVAGGGAARLDASAAQPAARSAVAIGAVPSWTCSKLASGSRTGRPAGRGEQGRELVHRRRRDRPVLLLPA